MVLLFFPFFFSLDDVSLLSSLDFFFLFFFSKILSIDSSVVFLDFCSTLRSIALFEASSAFLPNFSRNCAFPFIEKSKANIIVIIFMSKDFRLLFRDVK